MIIQICIGSSCHLKGSHDIVKMFKEALTEHHLEAEITLAGSFCMGNCNRTGVTVRVNDDIYTVTREGFADFFNQNVLAKLAAERS